MPGARDSLNVDVVNSIRYPVASVTCGPVPRGSTLLRDPVIIFGVLRRHGAHESLGGKPRNASTASVQRHVMLGQVMVRATMFERGGADDWAASWTLTR